MVSLTNSMTDYNVYELQQQILKSIGIAQAQPMESCFSSGT